MEVPRQQRPKQPRKQWYLTSQIYNLLSKNLSFIFRSIFETLFNKIGNKMKASIIHFLLIVIFLIMQLAQAYEQITDDLKQINDKIRYYEGIDEYLTLSRKTWMGANVVRQNNTNANITEYNNEYISLAQLSFDEYINHCQILTQYSIDSLFTFQTQRHIYLIANNPSSNTYTIYSDKCIELAKSSGTILTTICDRKLCEHGSLVMMSSNSDIIQCNENDNFTACMRIANSLDERMIGAVSRTKGGGNMDVIMAYQTGIGVLNMQQGRQRLFVSMQSNSRIIQIVDKHPFPLILSNHGWIYWFESTKYSLQLTKCPYISHNSWIYSTNPYSQFIYVLTTHSIYKLDFKSQSNLCYITRIIQLSQTLSLNAGWKQAHISDYQGHMFINNQVVNLEDGKVSNFAQCGQNPIFAIQPMKNNYKKGIYALSCCQQVDKQRLCGAVVFKMTESEESTNKSQFVAIISALAIFVFLIYYFLKPVSSNFQDPQPQFSNTQNQAYRLELQKSDALKSKNKLKK